VHYFEKFCATKSYLFKTDSGTILEASPPFLKTSLTILDEIKEVLAAVSKNTVSILDMVLFA